jgi:hypothetical protein
MLSITMDPKPNEIIPIKKLQEIAKEYKMEKVILPPEPGTKFGVEETKDAVKFGCKFGLAISVCLDGVDFEDVDEITSALTQLPSALSGMGSIPSEIGDMDTFELQECIDIVRTELKVENQKALLIVEKSLKVLYAIYDLVKEIKN